MATWKAPDAMNSTWSVFTGPCLVETVVPSMSGSRSRCTPSRETSPPMRPPSEREQILSISSRNTMPLFSTALDRLADDRVAVEQLVALLGDQHVVAVGDRDAARLGALAEGLAEHVADVDGADGGARRAGNIEHRQPPRRLSRDLDLDLLVVRARRCAGACGSSRASPARRRRRPARRARAPRRSSRPAPARPCAWPRAPAPTPTSTRSRTMLSTSRPT